MPAALADAAATGLTLDDVLRVAMLQDYNTRVVVVTTALLGLAAGMIGTFLLLRRRALLGDALSHATLPGVALGFIVMVLLGGDGKWLPGLLAGAAVFGLLGTGAVLLIRGATRLGDDAALGIVLSVFFGLGVSLLVLVQQMPQGSAAGLESFIYGKTASIVRSDLWLIGGAAAVIAAACALLYKEFGVLCFDEEFAAAQGLPVVVLDVAMMVLVTGVTVIGLQAVGLILVVALLITPPAAARFWTDHLGRTLAVSSLVGAAGGWVGASMSALVPRLPAGAIIVLVVAAAFAFSMVFGTRRGVLARLTRQWRLARRVETQHLLRAVWEIGERRGEAGGLPVATAELLAMRSWSPRHLDRIIGRVAAAGLVETAGDGVRLTEAGRGEAARVVRNHRLWEIFLITHADIAPSHVDRDADRIEHVLGPAMVEQLEESLARQAEPAAVPPSPHAV